MEQTEKGLSLGDQEDAIAWARVKTVLEVAGEA